MMSLLRFTIFVIFGVVNSQNYDENSQISYRGRLRQRSVEATTAFPPDPKIDNEGIQLLLTRLEFLCVEKLEFLISETNTRFKSLKNHIENLETNVENLGKKNQESSCPASPVVQNIENLEAKVENLGKNIQELVDTTRNLPSEVETIKRNVSFLINVTRSLADLSSISELKQIFTEGPQKLNNSQTAASSSCPLNVNLEKQYPKNCREVRASEKTASGTYMIQPEQAPKPFEAVCDLETRGGGWAVIQRRFDGSQDFYLDWQNYKNGFGNLRGEFWLGLENIHLLTGFEVNELLVEYGDFESQNGSALYSQFNIGSEMEGYSLKVLGDYSGDGGDSLIRHAGMKFTTKDKDQDAHPETQCAQNACGAWWYINCAYSNLNGKYFYPGQIPEYDGCTVHWYSFKYRGILKHTRMLVRPKV